MLPEADTFLRGGDFADENYGGETRLTVKRASPDHYREAFLRFDPSSVGGTVITARLDLTPVSVGPETAMTNEAAVVLDDTWDEHSLSWNNKPASSTVLGSWTPTSEQTVTLDVTHLVQTALREGKKMSIQIYSPQEISAGTWVHYGARENYAEVRPRLIISTIAMLYPTLHHADSWDSGHWSNGIARLIDRSGDVNAPTGWSEYRGTGKLAVDGQGVLSMQGAEPRIYLNGVPEKSWKNVEVTARAVG